MKTARLQLADAYAALLDAEIDAAIAEAEKEPHVFSKAFENSMERLMRTGSSDKKPAPAKRTRRVVMIIVAALIALALAACAVPQVRESLRSFVIKVFGDHVDYCEPDITKENIEDEYGIMKLTDEYVLTKAVDGDCYVEYQYVNGDGTIISLKQAAGNFNGESVDNEHGEYYEDLIDGRTVRLYRAEGFAHAAWLQDGYFFSLTYSADIELKEFESLIGSIEKTGAHTVV